MDHWTLIARIGLAALFAAVLGFERELKGQIAGLRTHILVSVGSCLFTVTGVFAAAEWHTDQLGALQIDVTRIPSQVVVGIGFLGGGAILRHGASIRGLTTAANLWVAAAIGLACGLGMLFAAGFVTLLVLFVLAGLKPLETWLRVHRMKESDGDERPS